MSAYTTGEGWSPAVELDLETCSRIAFRDMLQKLDLWVKNQPPPEPLALTSGWYDVTPQMAEDFLRRTPVNRPPELRDVKKYLHAMKSGNWRKTGQPLIFNVEGIGQDLGHRCLAGYLGKVTFPSYIVTDAAPDTDLFAYMDDGRIRSAGDALRTSGMNGASNLIASATKLAWRYDHDALSIMTAQPKIREITKPEIMEYGQENPLLPQAIHLLLANYGAAIGIVRNKAVLAFFAWKVLEHYGTTVLDEFLVPLGDGADLTPDSPILGLRARLFIDATAKKPELRPPHRLALLIRAFNLFINNETLPTKRGKVATLSLKDDEPYPRIEPAQAEAMAA